MIKAFTLIELLVVVAIIGVLSAVAVVTFGGFQTSAKEKACFQNFEDLKKRINSNYALCKLQGSSGSLKLKAQFWQYTPGRDLNFSCNNSFESIAAMTVQDFSNYAKNPFKEHHYNIGTLTYIGDPPNDGDLAYYPESAGFMLRVKCNGKVKRYQWKK